MEKLNFYKIVISCSVILSTIGIVWLVFLFQSEIKESLITIEGAWIVLIVILIRIGILSGMTIYILNQWFKQEAQYLSDIPFLFGLFFLTLIFGKALDIIVNFTFYTLNNESFLLLLKLRHFVIIISLFPMMYLSIGIILYMRSLNENRKKLNDVKYRDKLRIRILIIILTIESIAVALYINTIMAGIVMAIIAILSLLIITWMFYFAYKNQRLSQVHPLILSIGFGLYLVSQIIRPLAQNIIGEIAAYIVLSEVIDLCIFIIIFIGFILKVKYEN